MRHTFFDTGFPRSFVSVTLCGAISAALGVLAAS